jgi:hypothetical protein
MVSYDKLDIDTIIRSYDSPDNRDNVLIVLLIKFPYQYYEKLDTIDIYVDGCLVHRSDDLSMPIHHAVFQTDYLSIGKTLDIRFGKLSNTIRTIDVQIPMIE